MRGAGLPLRLRAKLLRTRNGGHNINLKPGGFRRRNNGRPAVTGSLRVDVFCEVNNAAVAACHGVGDGYARCLELIDMDNVCRPAIVRRPSNNERESGSDSNVVACGA